MKKQIEKNNFLDLKLINDFRQVINEHNAVFVNDIGLKNKYDLICVFLDRMTTAVKFLNEQSIPFEEETDFINFMVYACLIYDGINKLSENIYQKKPALSERKKLALAANIYGKPYFTDSNCLTDYVFFEFLRSLSFAHPYETDSRKRSFMDKGELFRSPWVISQSFNIKEYNVGVRIYSSKDGEITDLTVPFRELKSFVSDVYSNLNDFIKWAKEEIFQREKEWKKIKINRNQKPLMILESIKAILESRFVSTDSIDTAISYLMCSVSDVSNLKSVNLFKDAIIDSVGAVCNCVETLDYEGMECALELLYAIPDKISNNTCYQLEKIFCYLDEKSEYLDPFSNESWGLTQAKHFAEGFAKKWVFIDVDNLPYSEIKLLVRTACYLEKIEQEKEEKNL